MPRVDVVVVSYNSRGQLRTCVAPLAAHEAMRVIVVDNCSTDGTLETIEDLDVVAIAATENLGFGHGCNTGLAAGDAPLVLFLNPDAVIEPDAVLRLADTLEADPSVGAVGPKIVDDQQVVDFSQRRFPRARSTYAHALFLNQLFPRASWSSEMVSDEAAYERQAWPDWISGACLLTRRSLLVELGGFDDGFFLYCEDKDLCRRVRDAGYDVLFEPSAVAVHDGGASAPRASLMPVLALSRIRYARKHAGRGGAALEQVGVALTSITHLVVTRGGRKVRAGHLASLRVALRPDGAAAATRSRAG